MYKSVAFAGGYCYPRLCPVSDMSRGCMCRDVTMSWPQAISDFPALQARVSSNSQLNRKLYRLVSVANDPCDPWSESREEPGPYTGRG